VFDLEPTFVQVEHKILSSVRNLGFNITLKPLCVYCIVGFVGWFCAVKAFVTVVLYVKLHIFSTDIKTGESEVCCVLHILVSCCIHITQHVPLSTAVMWMSFYETNLLCFFIAILKQISRYLPEGGILC
jgi:hypothetical protein